MIFASQIIQLIVITIHEYAVKKHTYLFQYEFNSTNDKINLDSC